VTVATDQELVERIWARDATVWGAEEDKWFGWLDEPKRMQERVGEIVEFATERRRSNVRSARDGRSSLAQAGAPGAKQLHCSTTHPAMIRHAEKAGSAQVDTIVSSKSGGTLETLAPSTSGQR
jgi:hypothetical protein